MLGANSLGCVFNCPTDTRGFNKHGIVAFCFGEVDGDLECEVFHGRDRVTGFLGYGKKFFVYFSNS
jgi:hypothetical protein